MKLADSTITEIRMLHSEILEAARASLQNAIRIGELLQEEKKRAGHGNWLPWLKENVEFSEHTACRYMRCFDERAKLKSSTMLDLSHAYKLLAAKNGKIEKTKEAWEDEYRGSEIYATVLLDEGWHRYLAPHKDRIVNDRYRTALILECKKALAELIAMMDSIDEETFELKLKLPGAIFCGQGKKSGGPPPDGTEKEKRPKVSGASRRPRSNTNKSNGGDDKTKDAPDMDVIIQFENEKTLPGRSLRLDLSVKSKQPLYCFVNRDSKLGHQVKDERNNRRVLELLKQSLASELARMLYARGQVASVLGKDETERLEAQYNGDGAIIIQSMLDRMIYEQFA